MEGPHVEFCPCSTQALSHCGNTQMLHSCKTVPDSVFSLVTPSSSHCCECALLAATLRVKLRKDNHFLQKVGCCALPGGSLRSFSYAHSQISHFAPHFAVLLEGKKLRTEEIALCSLLCPFYTNVYMELMP